ncbi:MAG: hypothetical protein RMK18_03745 [Armatimonadota bacterium]|nr:hypothetical protein [Armatimonadota bacterium]MCX7778040.1 hypothetical protein [Armatimonadota bacterium]MDW8024962.1 hypothetical protein [Armatimonadota bacterium]
MICKLKYSNTKGQATILAVVLITGVALISAGFAAFVANSIHHTRALTGKASGRDIAIYGIEYAMQQLLTSPEGADWKPISDPSLPWDAYEQRRGWNTQYAKYKAPNGYFLLRVSKRPDGYIEIDSIGRPEPRSPIYYRIIAIVPQPIIQYALFLCGDNPYRQDEHVIGIGQIDFDGDGQVSSLERDSCLSLINGGIFSNDDLRVASQSIMRLFFGTNSPNHGIFVAGSATVSQADNIMLCDENGNQIDPQRQPQDSSSQNFWVFPLNNIPRFRDGYCVGKPQIGGIDVFRRLQPIPQPIIDPRRYRKLFYLGSGGVQVIYIDNRSDIQDNIPGAPPGLSPAQVQFWDWINVPSETDPRRNDLKSGWYYRPISDPYRRNPPIDNTLPDYFRYVPPGCEVELQSIGIDDDRDGAVDEDQANRVDDDGDGVIDEDGGDGVDNDNDNKVDEDQVNGVDDDSDGKIDEDGGGIVIRRHDRPNVVLPTSYSVSQSNVVIFSEGNLRIRGRINASLTVVSMGTIYIEGSLQTANPKQNIALLAKHNVCLNTTALLPIMTNARRPSEVAICSDDPQLWNNDKISLHYQYRAVSGPPLPSLTWRIPPFDNPGQTVSLVVLHSGLGSLQDYCFIRFTYGGNTIYHGEPLHFPTIDPDNDGKIGEDPIDKQDNDRDGKIDEDPGQPTRCYMTGLQHGIYWIERLATGSLGFSITAGLLDADNDNDRQVDEDPINNQDDDNDRKIDEDPPEVPYRFSRFKVELLDANGNPIPLWNIRVNAAIYSESGCFFIMPPPYFDDTKVAKAAERFRRFNYFDVEINGAIAEFTSARTMARSIGLGGVIYRTALDKLAYPRYDASGNLIGWQLVRFSYDPDLVQNPPPFLPVSSRPIIVYSGL